MKYNPDDKKDDIELIHGDVNYATQTTGYDDGMNPNTSHEKKKKELQNKSERSFEDVLEDIREETVERDNQ